MLASVILTTLIAGLGATQNIITPREYDIYNDATHDQWYNSSLVKARDFPLSERQQQRVAFRLTFGVIAVAGYTYSWGAEQIRKAVDACQEYQGGQVITAGQCVKDALRVAASYSMLGVAGYLGNTATVGLIQGNLGLANTIAGNQGQGENVKRSTVDITPFPYGSGHTSDAVIDLMNNALMLAKQHETRGEPQQQEPRDGSIQRRTQGCSERNGNLFTNAHYWKFADSYGLKIQCKNGCGYNKYNGGDMNNMINALVTTITTSEDLNAQFTLYDKQANQVFARCKVVFEDSVTDTCPELIDGVGCGF